MDMPSWKSLSDLFDEKERKKGYTNYLIFVKYAKILEDKSD